MDITGHRWGDAAHTFVVADQGEGRTVSIPADSYLLVAELAANGDPVFVPIEAFEETAEKAVVPEIISDRQFAQVLAIDGVITQAEALAWAARGDLPTAMETALTAIPEAGGQRFGARMLLSAATTYERHHPLVPTLGALLGRDAAALDSIWTRGAAL